MSSALDRLCLWKRLDSYSLEITGSFLPRPFSSCLKIVDFKYFTLWKSCVNSSSLAFPFHRGEN